MEKERMNVEVGVKYSGYGVLNEFGEWMFIPSQIGSRKGRKKLVVEAEDYTVYTTNNKVIFHVTLDRNERNIIIMAFLKVFDKLLIILKDYDFRRILSDKK